MCTARESAGAILSVTRSLRPLLPFHIKYHRRDSQVSRESHAPATPWCVRPTAVEPRRAPREGGKTTATESGKAKAPSGADRRRDIQEDAGVVPHIWGSCTAVDGQGVPSSATNVQQGQGPQAKDASGSAKGEDGRNEPIQSTLLQASVQAKGCWKGWRCRKRRPRPIKRKCCRSPRRPTAVCPTSWCKKAADESIGARGQA